jgi:hypothetical protein
MGTSATIREKGIVLPAPLALAMLALGVTLLFALALNAVLETTLGGPTASQRDATFSARTGGAPYGPAPNLSFARRKPAGG